MNDQDILKHIQELVNEEHQLMTQHTTKADLDEDQHARMHALEVHLDQLWDLLRQRRARRSAGFDPDAAQERDPNTVEHYLQ
ncbi:MAG TPA: DUF2630 family protein [Ktedonosporobacter sp.]|nr:DUF2630 family protein [Ktedonosporobacter sp.]